MGAKPVGITCPYCIELIEQINKILRCPESWTKRDIISRLIYAVEKVKSHGK